MLRSEKNAFWAEGTARPCPGGGLECSRKSKKAGVVGAEQAKASVGVR